MGHMIDQTTGKAAIAFVGKTPWHGLGQSLQPGQSIDDWRKAAGLDWEVKRAAVRYAAEQPGLVDTCVRDDKVFEDRFVLYRSDTQAPLSVVSKDYRTVQPAEVLDFFKTITNLGGFELETAGALSGGKRIWALAKVNDGAEIVGHDVVRPYLLLATSYDGTMATTAKFTSVRVVCNNTITLAAAEQAKEGGAVTQQVRVLHSAKFDPAVVRSQLGIVSGQWDRFVIGAKLLAEKRLTTEDAEALTYDLIAPTITAPPGQQLGDIRKSRGYTRVLELFDGKAKGAELVGPSAWGWLNAVTEWADWERGRSPDTRMNSAWFGPSGALKERAMQMALTA